MNAASGVLRGPSRPPSGGGPRGKGPLAGERVAFAGRLASLTRSEGREVVRRLGGEAVRRPGEAATVLVIGEGAASRPGGPAEAPPEPRAGAPRLLTERQFCDLAGLPSEADLRARCHAWRDVRGRFSSLTDADVRALERWGVARPVRATPSDRYYTFDGLAVLAAVQERLSRGAELRAVVRELLAERQGQLSLDLAPRARGASVAPREPTVLAFPVPDREHEAEEWFRRGHALERLAGGEEEAARAYARALELDPDLVPALINLANLHYLRNEPERARGLYLRAAGLGGTAFFQVHFNLANLAHDRGEYREARRLYVRALQLAPDYADAHFYLALTLEKLGLSPEARPHWRAYRTLEPGSEWARLAREMERGD